MSDRYHPKYFHHEVMKAWYFGIAFGVLLAALFFSLVMHHFILSMINIALILCFLPPTK